MRAKFFILILLTVLFSVLCMLFLKEPGYVLLSYKNRVLETSLVFFILVEAALIFTVTIAWTIWRKITGPRFGIQYWLSSRSAKRAQENTNRGLIYMAEENWEKAEQLLVQSADKAPNPLINYLSAARAANRRGETQQRDEFLRLAMEVSDGADIAVSLTQAELQFDSKQWESCVATLLQLKETSPKHPSVLKLLSEVYQQQGEWGKLQSLLLLLKKSKVLSKVEYVDLERSVYVGIMTDSMKSPHTQATKAANLTVVWNTLPGGLKKDTMMINVYCQLLVSCEDHNTAEFTIRSALEQGEWSDELVNLYGRVRGESPSQQLSVAESWLSQRANNAELTLALGRLSLQNQLWTKAIDYFETSLKLSRCVEAYRELGRVFAHQGDIEKSHEYLQAGLDIISQPLPELLAPQAMLKKKQPA